MIKLKGIIVSIGLLTYMGTQAQSKQEINQQDERGRAHGLWYTYSAAERGEPAQTTIGHYDHGQKIGIWYVNDGKGNLIANKKKSKLYSKENKNIIFFSNIEVGKFRGHDCVFLHYEGTRYVPTIQNNLDLSPFLLISAGDDGGFTHLPELKVSGLVPTFMKGYFEKQNNVDVLRLIGMKDVGPNEFNLTDITIK